MLWVDGQISSSFLPKVTPCEGVSIPGGFVITSEDVESNQMNFSVAVLPSLGGGHLHDLGGAVLQEKNFKSLQEIIASL